jgi:hypothetical protein
MAKTLRTRPLSRISICKWIESLPLKQTEQQTLDFPFADPDKLMVIQP